MKIIHGDSCTVLRGLPENSVDLVYTCPSPFQYYNDPNMIGGEEKLDDYLSNLVEICSECSRVLKPTGNLFIQLGDKFTRLGTLLGIPVKFEMRMIGEGWALNDRLIWHRTETSKRKYEECGFLKNYEYIFHFIHRDYYFNTKSKYINTSVFSYPLEDSYYTNEFDSGLPVELSKMVIDTCCPPNGTVLDPLCGSAKLGIVAKKVNRDFIGIDIDFKTVELARIRLGLIIH